MAVQYDEQGNVISGTVSPTETQNIQNNTQGDVFGTTTQPAVGAGVTQAQQASNTDSTDYTRGNATTEGTSFGSYGTNDTWSTSSTNVTEMAPVTVTASRTVDQQIIPNPLHSLASYTYAISLHLLDSATYNNLSTNPGSYIPNNVLIASGGRHDAGFSWVADQNAFPRNNSFKEDFYFDELKFTTYINKSKRNPNSNVIDVNFTIIEPNGFTLINRLLDACTQIGCNNYLMQPYLLQIDFYGYDDAGNPTGNIGHTKRIPITLIGMKTRITQKGAEYRVQAAPYNHKAFSDTHGRAPANFNIKAGTLSGFFGQGGSQSPANVGDRTADADTIVSLNKNNASLVLDQIAEDRGYLNALNTWNRYLQESNNRTSFDEYNVVFAPEILAQQTIVDRKRNPASVAADKKTSKSPTVDWTQQYFAVNSGTSIERVIDMIMRNSQYILNQIQDPSTDAPETIATKIGKPLKWFKIVPKVELKAWDYLANDYSKKITYYVKTWTVNNKHPDGPIGVTKGAVKEYNYLYTGKNHDVLDLQIDFDMQYYVQKVVDRNKQQQNAEQAYEDPNNKESGVGVVPTPGVVNPIRMVYVSQDVQESGQLGGTQTPARQTASAISKNLNEKSIADMINVKMRIIGDPTFIKQDDLFYQQSEQSSNTILVNNSISMDDGELYTMVKFNTPIDYDERYGLVTAFDQDSGAQKYGYNMFSGKYAIVTIDNLFMHGKFEQTLDLVRLHYQPEYDNLNGTAYPVGGANWFRAPNWNQISYPALQGFASGALPAGTLLTGLLANGTGLVSGIAGSLINTGIGMATSTLSNLAKDSLNQGISALKDWWNSPSISWENMGTGGLENLAGGGVSPDLINTGGLPINSDWGTTSTGNLIDPNAIGLGDGGTSLGDMMSSASEGLTDLGDAALDAFGDLF